MDALHSRGEPLRKQRRLNENVHSSSHTPAAERFECAWEDAGSSPSLPAEVWATTLDFLDYQSVLSCSAASKSFRRQVCEAMPLVTRLNNLDKTSHLNSALASRFGHVEEIEILSLLDRNADGYLLVKYDSVTRLAPFLTQFPCLERVYLGGRDRDGDAVDFGDEDDYWEEYDPSNVRVLIDTISGAFRSVLLPPDLRVIGLSCPLTGYRTGDSSCKTCRRACESFPLEQVVEFGFGDSADEDECPWVSKRPRLLNVCLSRAQIEGIVESRAGGQALVRPEASLLRMLGKGTRYEIHSGDIAGSLLYVVKYTENEADELKRIVKDTSLDVATIEPQAVADAIRRSFAGDDRGHIPPKNQCYLADTSLKLLQNELGINIDEEDFHGPVLSSKRNLLLLVPAIMSENNASPIHKDCLFLLSHALNNSDRDSVPIQQLIDMGVVPELVKLSRLKDEPGIQQDATVALGDIAWKSTSVNAELVVEAGAVRSLTGLLRSPDHHDLARDAAWALGKIAAKSAACGDAVRSGGALVQFKVQLMQHKDPFTAEVVSWALQNVVPAVSRAHGPIFACHAKQCLELIYKLMLYDEDEVRKNSCRALWYLLMHEEGCSIVYALRKPTPFLRLLELATAECETAEGKSIRGPASKIVDLAFTRNVSSTRIVIGMDALPRLKQFTHSQDWAVQKAAAIAICHTISACDNERQIQGATDTFPELIQLLAQNEEYAAEALCRIAEHGSDSQIKALLSQGVVRHLCDAIDTGDTATIEYALRAVKKILSPGRTASKCTGVKIVRCELQWIESSLARLDEENVANNQSLQELLFDIRRYLKLWQRAASQKKTVKRPGKIEQKIVIKGIAYPM